MPRYWVIAPYDATQPDLFGKAWQFDLREGVIAIGWRELGDPSALSQDELRQRIRAVWGSKVETLYSNILWRFFHEVAPGDIVIARRGVKRIVGVGTVRRTAFRDEDMGVARVGGDKEAAYCNFLGVDWSESERVWDKPVFAMHAFYEVPEERYRELVEGVETGPSPETCEFVLEKYLQEFIVTNFSRIFKDLELVGEKYPAADAGEIDILAKHPTTGRFVVIELKKGRESDKVVGQVLRYMGWVSQSLCTADESVRGLIICKEPDPKLTYALAMMPTVDVRYYQVNFSLSEGQRGQ